jgi:hypothetical protein
VMMMTGHYLVIMHLYSFIDLWHFPPSRCTAGRFFDDRFAWPVNWMATWQASPLSFHQDPSLFSYAATAARNITLINVSPCVAPMIRAVCLDKKTFRTVSCQVEPISRPPWQCTGPSTSLVPSWTPYHLEGGVHCLFYLLMCPRQHEAVDPRLVRGMDEAPRMGSLISFAWTIRKMVAYYTNKLWTWHHCGPSLFVGTFFTCISCSTILLCSPLTPQSC